MSELYPVANLAGLTFEEEVVFGTDPAGTKARLFAAAIKAAIGQTQIPDPIQQSSGLAGDRRNVRGAKSGTLTFDLPIFTKGGSESDFMTLAKRCGATHIAVAAATAKITAGAASSFVCLTADKGNLAVGSGFVHIPASGTPCLRVIVREQADTPAPGSTTFSVNQAFSTSPSNGDSWGAVDTIVPATGYAAASFAFYGYHGYGSQAFRKKLLGSVGKWKLAPAQVGGLLSSAWEWMVDNWPTPDVAALAMAARTGNALLPVLGTIVALDDTALAVKSFEFDPGLALQWDESQAGTHGRAGALYGKPSPVLSFSPLMDVDWYTKLAAATAHEFFFCKFVGSTDAVALYVPAFEIVEMGEEDDGQNVRGAPKTHVVDPGLTAEGTQIPVYSLAITH